MSGVGTISGIFFNTFGALTLVFILRKVWRSLRSVPEQVNREKGLTVFKFFFSPCARFMHVTTLLCKVPDVEFVEIDLSKGDQLQWWFLRVNPKHQVPACVDDGIFMAESRDLARHIFNKYNKEKSDEHWYPNDPAKRKEVDEWMEWSKPLHLCIEAQVALRFARQSGLPWRDTYGSMILIAPAPGGPGASLERLKEYITIADEMVGKRQISAVEDLNLGDLATMQEVVMAFECFEGTNELAWKDFPHLANLYAVLQKVPEFRDVQKPFLSFCEKYRQLRDAKRGETVLGLLVDTVNTFRFIPWALWNLSIYALAPFGPRRK